MTDNQLNNGNEVNNSAAPSFVMRGQYVKDLSFENPNAPASLMDLKEMPKVDVNVDLNVAALQPDTFEVTLRFTVKASTENVLFAVDLAYAGVFSLQNIPEDKIEQVLLVDGAFMLFPFARRVVADVTRDGGFPPLLLEPIDFFGLYMQKKQAN